MSHAHRKFYEPRVAPDALPHAASERLLLLAGISLPPITWSIEALPDR